MDPIRIYSLLERIGTLLRAELRREAAARGLALIQLEVVHYLGRCNRYSDTPGAVAEYFGATKGTISQTLAALDAKGLLRKVGDANDARLVHCQLTRRGEALLAQTLPPPSLTAAAAAVAGLEAGLADLLIALQRRNDNRAFGICHTCVHFEREAAGFQCGLTGEPLSRDDSLRLCREHEPAAAQR